MFRKLDHDSELGKQVSAFISKSKEEEHMTKKFTEEEYQKIVDIADRLLDDKNRADIELSTLDEIYFRIQKSSNAEENNKFKDLNQELALIALPKSRDWAHDQFVEKEKKYRWRYKKKDDDDYDLYLLRDCGLILLGVPAIEFNVFTEKEIIEAGYNPDMFDKEEVE